MSLPSTDDSQSEHLLFGDTRSRILESGNCNNTNIHHVVIKSQWFDKKSVMIEITNMSAVVRLEQEILLTKYSKIMFASVNHELRNPINVINNTLILLLPFVISE